MACSAILKGLCADCLPSIGGIKKLYIANFVDNAYTVSNGEVTAISENVEWYEYFIRKNTGSFTSTLNVDAANGTNYVSTEISVVFNKMETVKRIEMAALALADMLVVVEDENGIKWAFGADRPVTCTAGGGETGTAKSDANHYTLTLTDESDSYPFAIADNVTIATKNECA